jgi:hypothetical protein
MLNQCFTYALFLAVVFATGCNQGTSEQAEAISFEEDKPQSQPDLRSTDTFRVERSIISVENYDSTWRKTWLDTSMDTAFDDSLNKYFLPDQIIHLKQAKAAFAQINTEEEMAIFYRFTLQEVCNMFRMQVGPPETLEMGDTSPKFKWAWFTDYFPLVYGDVHCLDCIFSPMNDIALLVPVAARTPGKEDDLFLDALIFGNGSSRFSCSRNILYSSALWETTHCCMCTSSVMGDGRRLTLLKKIEAASAAGKLFKAELDEMAMQLSQLHASHYLYSKDSVLSEISQIIERPIWTEQKRFEMIRELKKIEKESQFNCAIPDACNW